jgi:hypothetical protein
MHAREMRAHEVHAREVHAHGMHAREMTFVRYTLMR